MNKKRIISLVVNGVIAALTFSSNNYFLGRDMGLVCSLAVLYAWIKDDIKDDKKSRD